VYLLADFLVQILSGFTADSEVLLARLIFGELSNTPNMIQYILYVWYPRAARQVGLDSLELCPMGARKCSLNVNRELRDVRNSERTGRPGTKKEPNSLCIGKLRLELPDLVDQINLRHSDIP